MKFKKQIKLKNEKNFSCSIGFQPDWSAFWTLEKAVKELKGFKFKGEGWYITKTDSILVSGYTEDGFCFYVWNDPNARERLLQAAAMPIVHNEK